MEVVYSLQFLFLYLFRKEQDLLSCKNRLNDQENLVLKLQMQIHELQARIEQLEQELEAEHRGRVRVLYFIAHLTVFFD